MAAWLPQHHLNPRRTSPPRRRNRRRRPLDRRACRGRAAAPSNAPRLTAGSRQRSARRTRTPSRPRSRGRATARRPRATLASGRPHETSRCRSSGSATSGLNDRQRPDAGRADGRAAAAACRSQRLSGSIRIGDWPTGLYFVKLPRTRSVAMRPSSSGLAGSARTVAVVLPTREAGVQLPLGRHVVFRRHDNTVVLGRPFLNRGVPFRSAPTTSTSCSGSSAGQAGRRPGPSSSRRRGIPARSAGRTT